jgi:hypothetical protein
VGVLEAALRSQQELGWFTPDQADSWSTRRGRASGRCFVSQLKSTGGLESDETTKAILTGAAFAGLFAGTGTAVKASTLLPSLRASSTASDQDQNQDQKSEKAKDKKDRHACKGQNSCRGKGACEEGDNGCKGKNSCKGKGGCRTDGKNKPA